MLVAQQETSQRKQGQKAAAPHPASFRLRDRGGSAFQLTRFKGRGAQ